MFKKLFSRFSKKTVEPSAEFVFSQSMEHWRASTSPLKPISVLHFKSRTQSGVDWRFHLTHYPTPVKIPQFPVDFMANLRYTEDPHQFKDSAVSVSLTRKHSGQKQSFSWMYSFMEKKLKEIKSNVNKPVGFFDRLVYRLVPGLLGREQVTPISNLSEEDARLFLKSFAERFANGEHLSLGADLNQHSNPIQALALEQRARNAILEKLNE